jgi:CcmD family protein
VLQLPFATPALPLDEAGKYVAGAYAVFVALILIYVVIMATRLSRIERELGELEELAAKRQAEQREKEPV